MPRSLFARLDRYKVCPADLDIYSPNSFGFLYRNVARDLYSNYEKYNSIKIAESGII